MPLWLDEGLAGYFELPPAGRAYDNQHLGSVRRWNAWFGIIPSLDHLEKCTDVEKMGKAEYAIPGRQYFMLHGSAPAREELVHLAGFAGHRPPKSARFVEQTPQTPPPFGREGFGRPFQGVETIVNGQTGLNSTPVRPPKPKRGRGEELPALACIRLVLCGLRPKFPAISTLLRPLPTAQLKDKLWFCVPISTTIL